MPDQPEPLGAVRVLGPVGIDRDGTVTAVPGQQGEVLSLLVAARPNAVRIDSIIDALWGDNPTKSARTGLGVVMHRLRSRMVGCGEIVKVHNGYRLDIEPELLDADVFERLLARARDSADRGDHADACEVLATALREWHGDPFQPFESHESVHVAAAALEELRRDAEDQLLDSLLLSNRADDAASWASKLVDNAPYRERRWHGLALALYRSGRQTESLRMLTRATKTLRDDIGVEPGPELRQLELDILEQADHLQLDARTSDQASPTAVGATESIRSIASSVRVGDPDTSFIGRDSESVRLAELLAAHRFISVIGGAGVGKTRLAARYVRSIAGHRVIWIDLVAIDEAHVVDALASQLSVSVAAAQQLDGVTQELRREPTLLVLDNCEHVVSAVAALGDAIVSSDDTTRILATSRTPLGSENETRLPVPPLDVDDAVRLLIERAYGGIVAPEVSRESLESLVDRLGASPLLIELVAEPIRSTSIEAVITRFSDVMTAATSDGTDPRHESLTTAIDWSVDLLAANERELHAALSVMRGGFSADDVETVLGRGIDDVRHALSTLCSHGLLTTDGASDPPRHRQADAISVHAHGLLERSGAAQRTRTRHADAFAEVARRVTPTLWTADEPLAVERLSQVRQQLDPAFATLVERGDAERASQLAVSMWDYSFLRLDIAQFAWFDDLIAMPELPEVANYADVLGSAAMAAWARNDFTESTRLSDLSLLVAPDEAPPLQGLRARFNVASFQEPDRGPMEAFAALINATIEYGPPHLRSDLQVLLTLGLSQIGEATAAADAARRGIDIAEKTANPSCLAWSTYGVGWSRLDDDPLDASRSFVAAARIARSVNNRFVESMAKGALVTSALRRGRTAQARGLLIEVISMWSRLETTPQLIRACREAVMVLADQGDLERARVALAHVELLGLGHPLAPPDQQRFDELAAELGEPNEPVGFGDGDTLGESIISLLRS